MVACFAASTATTSDTHFQSESSTLGSTVRHCFPSHRLIMPAAVIIFPVSYIVGDVLTEVYGYARARTVIWLGRSPSEIRSTRPRVPSAKGSPCSSATTSTSSC